MVTKLLSRVVARKQIRKNVASVLRVDQLCVLDVGAPGVVRQSTRNTPRPITHLSILDRFVVLKWLCDSSDCQLSRKVNGN